MYIFIMILFAILNYLIGSIPNGLIIGKIFKKVDIRESGSGSIGATNTARLLGKKWGAVVLFLDILKSSVFLVCLRVLADYFKIDFFHNISYIEISGCGNIPIYSIYGLFAVYGHCYSCFLKFNGGKAIATSVGVILSISTIIFLIAIFIFITVFLITRYVSLSSLITTLSAFIFSVIFFIFFKYDGFFNIGYLQEGTNGILSNFYKYVYHIVVMFLIVLVIFIKHIPNIKRLLNGSENMMKKNK